MEWFLALVVIFGLFWLLTREQKRLRSRTEEEYQQDVEKAGKSAVGAGLFELQKLLQPEARSGIEYVMDEQRGMAGEKQKAGDKPEE